VVRGSSEGQSVGARTATPDVFISYASQDATVANSIVENLETEGLRCWLAPRDVRPGTVYADAIVRAINEAKALVLALSAGAMASSHVGREVERAAAKKKKIIAFRIDAAPLSPELEYFLSNSQWIDVPTLGMPAALAKLAGAVGQRSTGANAGDPGVPTRNRKRNRLAILGAMGLGVGASLVLGIHFWTSKLRAQAPVAAALGLRANAPTGVPISDKSIAVLPFADMSEKKDQEYFADGMAEEILDLLAKIPGLHVPARTSSFYFKGKSEDIPTIARRLMVANVLEGSVRKTGNRVRITVQLVRADNGYHLWSETYDRTLDDIFKVQDDIAGEVVKALKVSLGQNEAPRVVATNNSDAHALLLQARFFTARATQEDLARAVDYYRQVIQLDSESAVAWAELSMALTEMWNSGFLPHGRTVQQQRTLALHAAERAISINPNLGEAHEALVEIRYWFDWDWPSAEAEVDKARALDPSSTTALTQAGGLAMLRNRPNDALRLWEQATTLDPLNSDAQMYLAVVHYVLGQFTEAEVAARKAIDLNPTEPGSHLPLVQTLLALGQQDAALAEIEKEPGVGYRDFALARAYIVLGRKADADAALSQLENTFGAEHPYSIATLHALQGEHDEGFVWLDKAYSKHDPDLLSMPSFTVEPDLQSLRGDPRYKAFLRKMKLPE
jgi:TolB-like protein/Tfp pilus assembly protein PilF